MNDIVIRAENLSKRYRLGEIDPHGTFREMLRGCAKLPGRMLRKKLAANGSAPADPNELWALKDVSFEVARGEVVGVIGRNGAGKSTLLKLLTRITRPTTGRIELRGRVGSLLEVGTGFHPELTGRENIFLNGAILGMARAEIRRKFDEIVEFSGVSRFLDTPVKRYSSGMRVRLAFAVAAHLDPEILLIDEVLAVGDVGFQKKCLGKMDEVVKVGRTVVIVSHNMAMIRSLCHRVGMLDQGELREMGVTDRVVDTYSEMQEEKLRDAAVDFIVGDRGWGEEYKLIYTTTPRTKKVLCGSTLNIGVRLQSPHRLQQVTAGFVICALSGERVVSMGNKLQQIPSSRGDANRWDICCSLGVLPLNAGSYRIHVYIGDGTFEVARFSDAFFLTIDEHDVFGWGNALPRVEHGGWMYWAPEWSIRPCETDN